MSVSADGEYRVFTDKEGRLIKAKILKVDPRTEKVTVERDNRRRVTVPANIFSEADQAYIKEWLQAQVFMSNSKLKVSIDKKKGKTGNDKSQTKRPKPPASYEIKLTNRSGGLLEGMHVEYCLYKLREASGKGNDQLDVIHETSRPIRINDRGTHTLSTKQVPLFRYYTAQTDTSYDPVNGYTHSTSYNKVGEDDLEGIWVRIHFKTKSGNTFMREIYEPKSVREKFAWNQR